VASTTEFGPKAVSSTLRSKVVSFISPVAIFLLNLALVYPLFTGEYTAYIGSIESAFISDARFIVENYPNLTWNPLWYAGFPFHFFYAPVLPYLMAVVHWAYPPVSIPRAYRIITALSYCLGPSMLYIFVKYLTKRDAAAWIAAVTYSIAPSTMYFVIPSFGNFARSFSYAPWSIVVLTVYGEGPHITALTASPIAALAFLYALRNPRPRNYVFAVLAIDCVALTNLIGFFSLFLILLILFYSELILGNATKKLKTALLCLVIAYGLVAFQYDISYVAKFLPYAQIRLAPTTTLIVVLIAVPLAWIFSSYVGKRRSLQPLLVSSLWFSVFAIITCLWYFYLIQLAPQANRYIPEANMGFAMLLGTVLAPILAVRRLESRLLILGRPQALLRATVVAIILILLVFSSAPFLQSSWALTKPAVDMNKTPEYVISEWLSEHVHDERVYATGTIAFWLNVFSDVPQLRGGADGAAANPWWAHVTYQINTGSNSSLAVLWCKALNIRFVVVNYPNASTPYPDYVFPQKFEGTLPLRLLYKGFGIFEVPLARPELVQAVRQDDFERLQPISSVLDYRSLKAYVDLVEGSNGGAECKYEILRANEITIEVSNSKEDTALLVKMTFDDGWKAFVNNNEISITAVGPHFMLLHPNLSGSYLIRLTYMRSMYELIGLTITVCTLLVIGIVITFRYFRRSPALKSQTNQTLGPTSNESHELSRYSGWKNGACGRALKFL